MGMENFARKITPIAGEKLTEEKAREATIKLHKEAQPETVGKLKHDLSNIKEKIVLLIKERDDKKRTIFADKNMDLIERNIEAKEVDKEFKEKLSPLEKDRNKIEIDIGIGHA